MAGDLQLLRGGVHARYKLPTWWAGPELITKITAIPRHVLARFSIRRERVPGQTHSQYTPYVYVYDTNVDT